MVPKPKPEKTKKKKRGKYVSPRKRLEIQLDDACRRYVKLRDGRCVICGSIENPQWGHLVTCACSRLRWNLKNVNQQCRDCNFRHEIRPEIYINWFINKWGLEEWNKLYALSQIQNFRWSISELELMLVDLQDKLSQIENRSVYVEEPGRYKEL